jgi:hypothetical protein
MHLEPEQIQRWLHGELATRDLGELERHVTLCSGCRAQLDGARQDEARLFGLLRQLDHAAPQLQAAAVVARARGPVEARGHPGARVRPARKASRAQPRLALRGWQRQVAAVVLALACGGVAYALPGSPLPGWFERIAGWVGGPTVPPSAAPERRVDQPAPAPPAPPPATAGIAVTPGERLVIHFAAAQTAGAVTVAPADGPDVVVQARNGTVTFTTHTGGLLIDNSGSTADYQIDLPRGAPWIEIQVADRRLFLQDRGRQVASAPADPSGRYVLTLVPRGR